LQCNLTAKEPGIITAPAILHAGTLVELKTKLHTLLAMAKLNTKEGSTASEDIDQYSLEVHSYKQEEGKVPAAYAIRSHNMAARG
jgi:hypothetical protein